MPHTVYLVDDEPWALVDVKKTFVWERSNMRIAATFNSSLLALDAILRNAPDVVCVDVFMPEMSGIELLQRARKAGVASIFIIISGVADFACAQQAMRYGAVEYCLKPLNQEECDRVLLRVSRMLGEITTDCCLVRNTCDDFQDVLDYIDGHLSSVPNLDKLAETFFVSPNTLGNRFREKIGLTFSEYVEKQRITCACRLLQNTSLSIGDVARLSGYHDPFYFAKVFRRCMYCTPSEYRKGVLLM